MLTKITIKNFKKLESAEIELDSSVILVGPNNSGKTSALQAITLWDLGLKKWAEKRSTSNAKKRVGVTINRRDLFAVPIPSAIQLWNDLNVRKSISQTDLKKRDTKNINIEIIVEGFTDNKFWELGFEFDYSNQEVFFCRSRKGDSTNLKQEIIDLALKEQIGYLPPMSGLSAEEDKLEPGSIRVRIGEGRTAEVLRNLCWSIYNTKPEKWKVIEEIMFKLFRININAPSYEKATGRISMTYKETSKKEMDLTNVGRGFQQILLIFSYIYAGENTILLLDEPDAHLEIIRQKEIYNLLSEITHNQNSQLIIATHSEAILQEASQRDKIIAFLGRPHIVNSNAQVVKSLTTIGFDQYILAEQKKWILYLEGSTDLAMLKAFAKVLSHPVEKYLEDPFVKYTTNNPRDARGHFYALKEAYDKIKGIALFDRINDSLQQTELVEMMWEKREIENYLPIPEVLERYATPEHIDLFMQGQRDLMKSLITDYMPPIAAKDKTDRWWSNTKFSDEFLDQIFKKYFEGIKKPILMRKGNYYELALLAKADELEGEIELKLDKILEVASSVVD